MNETNNVTKSIAHTKWNCKYHIVFAPKYRRKVFFEEKRLEIREILRTLCAWKGVDIVEGEICPDHMYLFIKRTVKFPCFLDTKKSSKNQVWHRNRVPKQFLEMKKTLKIKGFMELLGGFEPMLVFLKPFIYKHFRVWAQISLQFNFSCVSNLKLSIRINSQFP